MSGAAASVSAVRGAPADAPPGATGAVRVRRLLTTPVKGLRIGERDAVELTALGAAGDRAFVLVDDSGGQVSITRHGALTGLVADVGHDGTLVLRDGAGAVLAEGIPREGAATAVRSTTRAFTGRAVPGPWDAVLTERVGRPVRLVRTPPDTQGFDVRPVTLVGDGSLAALAAHAGGGPLDARRFRMLLELGGLEPWAEDGWDGRRLRVGAAEIDVRGPVPRCAATTRDPERGDRDVPTVRLLRELRGLVATEAGRGVPFGVYATVARPGTVRLGDAVADLGPVPDPAG